MLFFNIIIIFITYILLLYIYYIFSILLFNIIQSFSGHPVLLSDYSFSFVVSPKRLDR